MWSVVHDSYTATAPLLFCLFDVELVRSVCMCISVSQCLSLSLLVTLSHILFLVPVGYACLQVRLVLVSVEVAQDSLGGLSSLK